MTHIINSIVLNDGTTIPLSEGAIVVFVGPNNVGKSQALKDLRDMFQGKHEPGVIVTSMGIEKPPVSEVRALVEANSDIGYEGNSLVHYGYDFAIYESYYNSYESSRGFTFGFDKLLSAFIDTERRLQVCSMAPPIEPSRKHQHPVHFAVYDNECRNKLDKAFFSAFGTHIVPDRLTGMNPFLRIGQPVSFPASNVSESTLDEFSNELSKRKVASTQGDGMRSFLGIMLELVIGYRKVFFIDEPESFLHPPQARAIGLSIGDYLEDTQQAFIATHSKDVLLGLLESAGDRVNIVRITRKEDVNKFSSLSGDDLQSIAHDSLLRHSDILEGIFRPHVVLCESDSDCKLYSIMLEHLAEKRGRRSDALFIHCGGKHRMPSVLQALRKLDVAVYCVVDIDVLNNADILRGILSSIGGDFDSIAKDRDSLAKSLEGSNVQIKRQKLKSNIEDIVNSSNDPMMNAQELEAIQELVKAKSPWQQIKHSGASGIPSGDLTRAYERIQNACRESGVFIVPCGELEGFVREVGGHGPRWVNSVLEQYPNLDAPVYRFLKDFIESWGIL